MIDQTSLPLLDIVRCVSEASDRLSPQVSNHHNQVAYIATSIADQALGQDLVYDLALAGLVHDVGAPTLSDRLGELEFPTQQRGEHAEAGWLLLRDFEPLGNVAPIVRFHHVNWDESRRTGSDQIPPGAHVLHLAESVSALLDRRKPGADQALVISAYIQAQSGTVFEPSAVDAFLDLAKKDYFWLDASSPSASQLQACCTASAVLNADLDMLMAVSKLISKIVDFRSRYTATHSGGVAACAEALARAAGFSMRDCAMMRIAGYLHDLGKLSVPTEILEKLGPLTDEDHLLVKTHAYHTHRALERIDALKEVNSWASLHHERLDGTGYPFKMEADSIPLPARIMAVADTFTALSEDRPHRKALNKSEALDVVRRMANHGKLDSDVVFILESHLDEVYYFGVAAHAVAAIEYTEFRDGMLARLTR